MDKKRSAMKLRPFTSARRRRADIDMVIAAYSAWRAECDTVRNAYVRWVRAATNDAHLAFTAYRSALDREERAAEIYARLLPRAQPRSELDVARQLAQLAAPIRE